MTHKKMFNLSTIIVVIALVGVLAWNRTTRAGYEPAEYQVIESDGKLNAKLAIEFEAKLRARMKSKGRPPTTLPIPAVSNGQPTIHASPPAPCEKMKLSFVSSRLQPDFVGCCRRGNQPRESRIIYSCDLEQGEARTGWCSNRSTGAERTYDQTSSDGELIARSAKFKLEGQKTFHRAFMSAQLDCRFAAESVPVVIFRPGKSLAVRA